MGKRIISQRRGRGTTAYRFPSHRSNGKIRMAPLANNELFIVDDIFHNQAHSAPLARLKSEAGTEVIIPAAEGMYVGQKLTGVQQGVVKKLLNVPVGRSIYNIELSPGDGGKLIRSSGSAARLVAIDGKKAIIRMPSGVFKTMSVDCRAVIGTVAGAGRLDKPLVKAGNAHYKYKSRNKLWPRTSPIHMNSVDHPFGGGRHPHTGKPETTSRHAPPGRKVGYIAAKRTGKR
ncbi:50S ribosomal protein L2 [Candidatus Undinarchaeota archaeon]